MNMREGWGVLGKQITVGLTLSVALLSVLTGIAKIGQQTISGPLGAYIPPGVQETVGFTGALTGFLMMASALGLRRGLRAAWYSTIILLPITAIQGALQFSAVSLPLIVLSLLAIPNVLVNRRRFERELSLSTSQLAALMAIVGAQTYGTVGAYALQDHFRDIETLVDAFYFTIVTASTVGYGDVTPVPQSQTAKLFSMSVIIVGTASFAIALGTLLGPAIEDRFQKALGRMTETQLNLMDGHLLILGHGDLTDVILEEIGSDDDYLIMTLDRDWAETMRDESINVLIADPSDESALERAGIDKARAVVVATNNDAEDALAVLTARQMNPDVRIVSAATNRENVKKLRLAGANTVISPASIGGHLIVQSALGDENIEEVAERIADEHE